MKKQLQFLTLAMAFMLFASLSLFAQEYHYSEGFMENGLPEGWTVKDVSYSNSATNAANMVDTAAHYCAKMKTNDGAAWLQAPKVNSAGVLSFWCKVKDASLEPTLTIQTSTDGEIWTDLAVNPAPLDLQNDSTFQNITVDVNMSGPVIIRFYVVSVTAGTTGPGTITVDDIQLTKPTPLPDDVSLVSITIGGGLISGFDFSVLEYNVEIPINGSYEIDAVANNPNATVEVTQLQNIIGTAEQRTASVKVTGENGTTTATTKVTVTRLDYFVKEGFGDISTQNLPMVGWTANHFYVSSTNMPPGSPNLYPGTSAFRFTGGHPTGSLTDPGTLQSPKLANVGTLSFWVSLQKSIGGESLKVTMKKGFGMPTELVKLTDTELTLEWKEVKVDINETDSIEILIEGVCDINDDAENRIWIDDFMLTGITTSAPANLERPTVSVYPNPVADVLRFEVQAGAYQHLSVYNVTGQRVLDYQLRAGQSSVNLGQLSNGIYFVSFSGTAGNHVTKVIKQ